MMYLYLIPVHCFVADSDVVEVSVVTTELVPIPKDDATAPVFEITTSMHNGNFRAPGYELAHFIIVK